MDKSLLPNVRENVQALRNVWSTKVPDEQKFLKPKQSNRVELLSLAKSTDGRVTTNKSLRVTFYDEKPIEPPSPVSIENDNDDLTPLPPPPASIVFKQQVQSMVTLKQTVTKMFDIEKNKRKFPSGKTNGIHRWSIARHVFRSGLIFVPSRRASDSIIPLLIKTHRAQNRPRTNSLDSNCTITPFENLIDYIAYHKNDDISEQQLNLLNDKTMIKRTISDATACINRNKLNDTIAQYETIMRHLKNYDKFMAEHPQSLPRKENLENFSSHKSSVHKQQTQSLARNAGRTFTEFFMNDFLSTQTNQSPAKRLTTIHTASQTDLAELIKKVDLISMEDTKTALNELDTVMNHMIKEPIRTANSEIILSFVSPPPSPLPITPVQTPTLQRKEKPLMQRLFEGKKTAYAPNELQMESSRIPEELVNTLEIAKTKCFFTTEQLIYSAKMIKIDRRGYKQHVRLLCLTTERVYIITKKKPYPKEALFFKDILNITVTPRKDGFMCFHTRETREDRGDWLLIVDHPCEFLTQLFMAMGRNHNNDSFLKFKTKFKHTRRNLATLTDECLIESRPSDTFHIAFENYDVLVIYAP